MRKPFALPMNLQTFAEEDVADETVEEDRVEGEEVATSQADDSETGQEDGQEQPNGEDTDDVTKQESFAKRLKESTDKAIAAERVKWQKEAEAEKQAARDAYIAEQNYEWQGKPITTEAEYKQALREKEMMDELSQKDLPEDVVQELVENRKFRETFTEKQRQEQEFQAFLDAFPDVEAKNVPDSVWEDVAKGRTLVDAYTRYENQSLKEKLMAYEKDRSIEKQNEENAQSSTGSVTGKGSTTPAFFTQEQVSKMSQEDVNKNWDAIMESQKKWYQ